METLTIMRQAYWQADPREDKKIKSKDMSKPSNESPYDANILLFK